MEFDKIYDNLKENIDLEKQSPCEVLNTLYNVMDSVDSRCCMNEMLDGLTLFIRNYNSEWSPKEDIPFTKDLYSALNENIEVSVFANFFK